MKIFLLILLFTSSVFARPSLQVGDILLQPLDCWSCSLIEEQENSSFSHIGIVVKVEGDTQLYVAEAYGSVKLTSVVEFLSKTATGEKVLIRRVPSLDKRAQKKINKRALSFIGRRYDRKFLWGNSEMYCSELVFKAYSEFINFIDLRPKTMKFDINPKLWDRYFRGETPRGKLGISPEDFNKSYDFIDIDHI